MKPIGGVNAVEESWNDWSKKRNKTMRIRKRQMWADEKIGLRYGEKTITE